MSKEPVERRLDKAFDVEDAEIIDVSATQQIVPVGDASTLPAKVEQTQIDANIHDALSKIKEIAKIGVESATDLAALARELQHPRAFEALAGLLKSATDAAKAVVDIEQQKKEIAKIDRELEGKTTPTTLTQINNPVYTMTTTQMLDEIRKAQNDTSENT